MGQAAPCPEEGPLLPGVSANLLERTELGCRWQSSLTQSSAQTLPLIPEFMAALVSCFWELPSRSEYKSLGDSRLSFEIQNLVIISHYQ